MFVLLDVSHRDLYCIGRNKLGTNIPNVRRKLLGRSRRIAVPVRVVIPFRNSEDPKVIMRLPHRVGGNVPLAVLIFALLTAE
jgi:hypothetical protein